MAVLLIGEVTDGALAVDATAKAVTAAQALGDVTVLCAGASAQAAADEAAKIDGASPWKVFRYIQLPKMRQVLIIAVLLRFIDSFIVYTEPFVLTGGGPGNATTFLSIDLVKSALGEFNLGYAAAMSVIYFLISLFVCWLFYTLMTQSDAKREYEQ